MVEIEEFPQATYNESIVAAALAGDLPDIIDMDGPVMPQLGLGRLCPAPGSAFGRARRLPARRHRRMGWRSLLRRPVGCC